MLLRLDVTFLDSVCSTTFVAVAFEVPRLGCCVAVSVYIPPV